MTPELLALEASTPGWLHPGEGEMLAKYAQGRLVVEIGSYCGKSTLWLASTARHVVSIDPHRGNPEMAPGRECHHPEVWDEATGTIDSAPALRRTLWRAGLEDKVTVICQAASVVAGIAEMFPDMVFIDGDHDGQAPVDDYIAWGAKASVVAFHDSDIGFVRTAWQQAVADGFELVDAAGSLKVYVR